MAFLLPWPECLSHPLCPELNFFLLETGKGGWDIIVTSTESNTLESSVTYDIMKIKAPLGPHYRLFIEHMSHVYEILDFSSLLAL